VEERSVYAAKNLMRFVALAVVYGVVSSQSLSSILLQMLDECNSGAGGKLTAEDLEIVLETIMAGLPLAANKLSSEQALDYGSILETMRKLMSQREQKLLLRA